MSSDKKEPIPAFYLDDMDTISAKFGGKSLAEIFHTIHQTNYWDNQGTVSGPGSDVDQTRTISSVLPDLFARLSIRSLLDAPCGDLAWIQGILPDDLEYTGMDIVPEIIASNKVQFTGRPFSFILGDLTEDPLPRADLILCRDCLVHFSETNIRKALTNFTRSGSTWLLMTSFTGPRPYQELPDGGWRALNFQLPPIALPEPDFILTENCTELNGQYSDKALCLWSMKKIAEGLEGK